MAGMGLAGCGDEQGPYPGPRPGTAFVAPEVTTLDGVPYKWPVGQPLLVNFWATWCRPCRAEMPAIDALYRQSRARGLAVLAVSVDTDLQLVREYVLQSGVSFPVLLDRGGERSKAALAVASFPTTLLVERSGAISAVVVGARDWEGGSVRASVEALLT
jgi:thiol-disulfide isomerase/thioredoxin